MDPVVEVMVDTAAVAKHLGVTERTIRNWVDHCGLPAYRLGGVLRFKRREVEDWIQSSRAQQRQVAGGSDQ